MEVKQRILTELVRRIVEAKTIEQYRARLWSAAQRLFTGGRDSAFMATFIRSIDQQLTEAWNKGADDMGVAPDEMSADDRNILEAIINNETDFIKRMAGDIQAAKDAEMTPEDFERQFGARVDLWANRYNETVNRAHVVFGQKARLIWEMGATEEHCPFCSALNGIVAWGYEWEEARFHPQMPPNPTLSGEWNGGKGCEGWHCDCGLNPTTRRRTARALDKLMTIATAAHL
jgi:hypothetical protein